MRKYNFQVRAYNVFDNQYYYYGDIKENNNRKCNNNDNDNGNDTNNDYNYLEVMKKEDTWLWLNPLK